MFTRWPKNIVHLGIHVLLRPPLSSSRSILFARCVLCCSCTGCARFTATPTTRVSGSPKVRSCCQSAPFTRAHQCGCLMESALGFSDSCSHLSSTKARTCESPAWSNSVGNERPIVLVPFLAPSESGSHLARPTLQELRSAFPIGVCLVSTGFRIATLVQTFPLASNEFVRDRP